MAIKKQELKLNNSRKRDEITDFIDFCIIKSNLDKIELDTKIKKYNKKLNNEAKIAYKRILQIDRKLKSIKENKIKQKQ
jgi:hypothetical protein